MRWATLFVFLFALAGCCGQHGESPSPGETEAASAAKDCPTGECCSGVNRAAILKKSQ